MSLPLKSGAGNLITGRSTLIKANIQAFEEFEIGDCYSMTYIVHSGDSMLKITPSDVGGATAIELVH